jgi:hypothetical protein
MKLFDFWRKRFVVLIQALHDFSAHKHSIILSFSQDLAPELRDEADEPEVASSPAVPSLPAVPAPVPARNPATNSSTSSAPATNAPVRSAASAAPAFNEADINMLCQMGFSRPQVVEALTLASGNVEMAASYLHFG